MTAVGLEPTTNRLKVDCSTTELRGHVPGLRNIAILATPPFDRCYCNASCHILQ